MHGLLISESHHGGMFDVEGGTIRGIARAHYQLSIHTAHKNYSSTEKLVISDTGGQTVLSLVDSKP